MTQNKILLFGKDGQLGSNLYKLLANENLTAVDYPEINFKDPQSIIELIDQIKPRLIINAAAYTDVDGAESDQETAYAVNGYTVAKIANKAKELHAGLIHYSTDFVFDGTKATAYNEEDRPAPINVYGASKLLGDEEIQAVDDSYLVFRLSWVYSTSHPCFVTKVLSWARKQEIVRVVDDQISNPTWATMVAEKTLGVIQNFGDDWYQSIEEIRGIYHLSGDGGASRLQWAKEIVSLDRKKHELKLKSLLPASSSDFSSPAARPSRTLLNCDKFKSRFNTDIPHWKSSLKEAMENKNPE